MGEQIPSCIVQGKCGMREIVGPNKGKYWDYCVNESRSFLDSNSDIIYGKNYFRNNLIGIIFFYIIFVFAIPYFLYTSKYNKILEVYLPNFDLLATAISFGSGLESGTWRGWVEELYNPASKNLMGFISTLMINYMALMGVIYLVAMHTKRSKSIAKGLGVGIVMIFLTYLLPNQIIGAIQLRIAKWVRRLFHPYNDFMYIVGALIGLGVAALFIGAEKVVLSWHEIIIDPFSKKIVDIAQKHF